VSRNEGKDDFGTRGRLDGKRAFKKEKAGKTTCFLQFKMIILIFKWLSIHS
jgi:hypothetical protein